MQIIFSKLTSISHLGHYRTDFGLSELNWMPFVRCCLCNVTQTLCYYSLCLSTVINMDWTHITIQQWKIKEYPNGVIIGQIRHLSDKWSACCN